jgi:hypothetical protein
MTKKFQPNTVEMVEVSDMHVNQKRPISVKRDLLQCQKRPITVSKETYYSVKRDLLQCQKRPITKGNGGGE